MRPTSAWLLTGESKFTIGHVVPTSLTNRQKQIYDFPVRTVREKGYAPSSQEIGSNFKDRLHKRRLPPSPGPGEKGLHPQSGKARPGDPQRSGGPANKNYSLIVVSGEEVASFRILGKPVGLTRKI
jgi:hypothetical protein